MVGAFTFLLWLALLFHNWQVLISSRTYDLDIAGSGPIGVLFGLALLFSPASALRGKPGSRRAVVVVLLLGIIGMVIGGVNFYLMDHYWR